MTAMAVSLPMCSLDDQGMREQRERYARIAKTVTRVDRQAGAVRLMLAEDFDRRVLEELVQIEARCCPFFEFALDMDREELSITVDDPEMLPAFEAIVSELGAGLAA